MSFNPFSGAAQISSSAGPIAVGTTTFTALQSVTPAAGTYLVWAACWADWVSGSATSGSLHSARISAGGVPVTDSIKSLHSPGVDNQISFSLIGKVTVNGAQAIVFEMANNDNVVIVNAENIQLMLLKA
jgi:hypothetical protein